MPMMERMKVALNLDEALLRRLKALAIAQRSSLRVLVEAFLREGVRKTAADSASQPARVSNSGLCQPLVDIADRVALEAVMANADLEDKLDRQRRRRSPRGGALKSGTSRP